MILSVYCDSPKWREESDICLNCLEHSDFYETDLDEEANPNINDINKSTELLLDNK